MTASNEMSRMDRTGCWAAHSESHFANPDLRVRESTSGAGVEVLVWSGPVVSIFVRCDFRFLSRQRQKQISIDLAADVGRRISTGSPLPSAFAVPTPNFIPLREVPSGARAACLRVLIGSRKHADKLSALLGLRLRRAMPLHEAHSRPLALRARFRTCCARVCAFVAPSARTWLTKSRLAARSARFFRASAKQFQ